MTPPTTGPNRSPSDPALDEVALLAAAREAYRNSYSPYSGVRVGAALLDEQGRVHLGCNVENASFGLTICAERSAVQRAVGEGVTRFVAIAIATDREHLLPPCGACRQVMTEFAPDLRVLSVGAVGEAASWTLPELLPAAFRPGDLA